MVRKSSILVISSHVVSGQVGIKAMLPAFRALKYEAITLQTTMLAAHPAAFPEMGPPAGAPVPAEQMVDMAAWLQSAGALDHVAAVVSGYLPTPAHVDAVAKIVNDLRSLNRDLVYCCDPICGDNDHLYLPDEVAAALRDKLLPLASIATPNRFELEYLTGGQPITDTQQLVRAARTLNVKHVAVTSAPASEGRIAAVSVGREVLRCESAKAPSAPHGMGDLFSALYLALKLDDDPKALGIATGTLAAIAGANMETRTLPHGPLALSAPLIQETLVVPEAV
jgi:pyridoxine kinase